MRLLFLTSSPLRAHTGPLARLWTELSCMSTQDTIELICLGKNPDDVETQQRFPAIQFTHIPLEFVGWEVVNLAAACDEIEKRASLFRADLVVLHMEIWDLMRELGKRWENRLPFATVLHALPFLGAPQKIGKSFFSDVQAYLETDLQAYRKSYIRRHMNEASEVFRRIRLLANNKTVASSFRAYFPDIPITLQSRAIASTKKAKTPVCARPRYDFVYMARMEPGKGVEYFESLLPRIAKQMGRPITFAVLGKIEDSRTEQVLDRLIQSSGLEQGYEVEFLGWADESLKAQILGDAGIFLYPSYYDNYPTVLNEALSFGLGCITWEMPFSRLNYGETRAVLRVPFLEMDAFARSAADAFSLREELRDEAIRFVEAFDTPAQVAEKDRRLFSDLAQATYGTST